MSAKRASCTYEMRNTGVGWMGMLFFSFSFIFFIFFIFFYFIIIIIIFLFFSYSSFLFSFCRGYFDHQSMILCKGSVGWRG